MRMRLGAGAAAAVAAAVFASLAAGQPALAKWSSAHTEAGAQVSTVAAKVELVTKDAQGQDQVADAVVQGDQTLTVPFGLAEAQEVYTMSTAGLAAPGGDGAVYWAKLYELRGQVSGTIGFTYSGGPAGQFAEGTYQENLVLFPVGDAADCSSAQVEAKWGTLPGQAGVANDLGMHPDREPGVGYAVSKTYSQLYCLATRFAPTKVENTATAEVAGVAPAEDSWWAFQYPDPADEAETGFAFDIEFEYAQ